MAVGKRISRSHLLVAVFALLCQVLPALSEVSADESSNAAVAVAGAPSNSEWAIEFPSYLEDENSTANAAGAPAGKFARSSSFAWIKFLMILLACFVWLRAMRLCMDDRRELGGIVDRRGRRLFAIGFVGILTAILLPAYLIGAVAIVLTCGFPIQQFMKSRNAQVNDPTPRLQWKHLFFSPVKPFRTKRLVESNSQSGIIIGTAEAQIVLLGKSVTGGTVDVGIPKEDRFSPGFQTAIKLIDEAVNKRATDLHVSTKDKQVAIRMRLDGNLTTLDPLPFEVGLSVINVFKVLCDLNIADKRRSQDGSFRADVSGRRLSFRVSSQGTHTGEKLSIRILDPAHNLSTFAAVGMTDALQERMTAALSRKSGLILFVGATGAGKSTTAYAGLRTLDSGESNIVTIEDPIEYSIPSVDQIEVNVRIGQTFEAALRSVLRQDADVLMIGEIRDEETAKIACQAATTGQLVLATMHANDAVSAVFRMSELGVDPHNLASALRAVVAQQLIRKLCMQCRIAFTPEAEALGKLGLSDYQGELYQTPDPAENPCLNCNGRGFLGRTGIFELFETDHAIRDLIREKASATTILAKARENGMTSLWAGGQQLVRDGIISSVDFLRVVDES